MGENMEVKTMSVHSLVKKKKQKSILKKCMQLFLQTHTGNVHKGLKPKLLPTRPYQHRQIYYPFLAHQALVPNQRLTAAEG